MLGAKGQRHVNRFSMIDLARCTALFRKLAKGDLVQVFIF